MKSTVGGGPVRQGLGSADRWPGRRRFAITSSASAGVTSIEVDGSLDVVTAYDLRCCLEVALRDGSHFVGVDLTRVTSADVDGVRGLQRCCDAAIASGVVLALTGCSRPFRADLADVVSRIRAA